MVGLKIDVQSITQFNKELFSDRQEVFYFSKSRQCWDFVAYTPMAPFHKLVPRT